MYNYAGNTPVKYVDPNGNIVIPAVAIYYFAVFAATTVELYLLSPSGQQGIQAASEALSYGIKSVNQAVLNAIVPIKVGSVAIGGCVDLYNYVSSKIDSGSVARAKENNNKEPTVIYRTESGNGTNLTPRTPNDSTGLSYSLTKPSSTPYTVTTMKAVNTTGVLSAVKDGPNHVTVIPTDMSKMPEWQATREHANENPHVYTKILQSISLKVRK